MTKKENGTGLAFVFTVVIELLVLLAFFYPTAATVILLIFVVAIHMFIYNILLNKKHNTEMSSLNSYIQLLEKIASKELSNGSDKNDYPRNKG